MSPALSDCQGCRALSGTVRQCQSECQGSVKGSVKYPLSTLSQRRSHPSLIRAWSIKSLMNISKEKNHQLNNRQAGQQEMVVVMLEVMLEQAAEAAARRRSGGNLRSTTLHLSCAWRCQRKNGSNQKEFFLRKKNWIGEKKEETRQH